MKSNITLLTVVFILIGSCTDSHLVGDNEYRAKIERTFNERKHLAAGRDSVLFSVFKQNLSFSQKEALEFLYAYMPLNDLADYNGDFFLANSDISLQTKKASPWAKDIPDDIFLHYVLPYRVNNENLDSFRIVYFDEILQRIKGKNIREAALEINHWCHEKVSYQPSDIRTSGPMSTILSARGRCGEESTFTVAALRTAGIPARQVYTPRWAHSDDNHAWVEVWIDGNWYFMGACEPAPSLDEGWFKEPARRAMMVNTKSFGASFGTENAVIINKNYVEVNNLSKYAPTKRIFVKVIDKLDKPVADANVEYRLYNYAEFYPIAVVPTNEKGISQLETGFGDLLIWAYYNKDFNFKKISVGETDTLVLRLNLSPESQYSLVLDLDVPEKLSPLPGLSEESLQQNKLRFEKEDTIRQNYIDSWISKEEVISFAKMRDLDNEKTVDIFSRSMGNFKEILSFLDNCPDSLIDRAVLLLEVLSDKDLRDIKEYVLKDHLTNCQRPEYVSYENGENLFLNYILNPRIANEMVSNWRGYFKTNLPEDLLQDGPRDMSLIVRYIDNNIQVINNENYYNTPITPTGVDQLKISDDDSRSVYFVAICRTIGIPARLEPGTNTPQYFSNNIWNNIYFGDQKRPELENGYIRVTSSHRDPIPEYYIHFTIARFENGRYNTLEYDYNKKITDFTDEMSLPAGNYMIVTGNRISDSKILSGITFFNLAENQHKTVDIKLRDMPQIK